jgi:hypothetical protein
MFRSAPTPVLVSAITCDVFRALIVRFDALARIRDEARCEVHVLPALHAPDDRQSSAARFTVNVLAHRCFSNGRWMGHGSGTTPGKVLHVHLPRAY